MAAVVALPNRQRSTPIAFATEGPIDIIIEPITKTTIFNMVGDPVDLLIERNQAIFML